MGCQWEFQPFSVAFFQRVLGLKGLEYRVEAGSYCGVYGLCSVMKFTEIGFEISGLLLYGTTKSAYMLS